MSMPNLESARALVAGGISHAPGTLREIRERLNDRFGWNVSKPHLIRILTNLRENGFAARGDVTRARPTGEPETVYCYWLTDDGRRALLETCDQYAHLVSHVTGPPPDSLPRIITMVEDTSTSSRPPRDRHPEPQELAALLDAAPPEIGPPVRVILALNVPAAVVCRALICDFDRSTRALRLKGQFVRMPADLVPFIFQAIGKRQAGPLFIRRTGRPWNQAGLTSAFRRARDAAGLPSDLVLVGRHDNHKGNYRKQSSHRTSGPAIRTRS